MEAYSRFTAVKKTAARLLMREVYNRGKAHAQDPADEKKKGPRPSDREPFV
jgi:hypothetical protein